MSAIRYSPLIVLTVLAASAVVLGSGCAETSIDLGSYVDANAPPPSFTDLDAGTDGDVSTTSPQNPQNLCIATECPEGFATCAAENGPAYKCGTDLAHDPKNCGACGHECLVYEPLHMSSRCIEGVCELECMNSSSTTEDRRNCNGVVDDGCEVDVLTDPRNCGACGKACPADQPCLNGKCGCPAGKILCGDKCINPKTDDENCGACGNACEQPADSCAQKPARVYYGCMGGTCGHLKCGGTSADCNNDVATDLCASDGCEVEDIRTDPNNCGGCGIKCKNGEECIDEGFGVECAVRCSRFGKVYCPDIPALDPCVDFLTDPDNCGGCGRVCPKAGPNEIRACKKGLCANECVTGFADCNADTSDGCETNLMAHPANCGACGNRCDIGAGQPCVEGECLMTTCKDQETH